MAHAVFIQNPISIYDDQSGIAYHFPKRYLNTVRDTVGDWVVFYESRKGAFGYTGVQQVLDVIPDPERVEHYYARLVPETEWSFEHVVPRADQSGKAYEVSLRKIDGSPMSGGASVSAVRRISPAEFGAIVQYGLSELTQPDALPRVVGMPAPSVAQEHQFNDAPEPWIGAPVVDFRPEILTSRKARDASFARQVKVAYCGKCAMSGLALKNGGGRPEVEAAHIRPVSHKGPDTVRNGLALSGTLHWMFDRGLVSVAEDYSILISHNKVPQDIVDRLIVPDRKLLLPEKPRDYPHPEYLQYHREQIFGQGDSFGAEPQPFPV